MVLFEVVELVVGGAECGDVIFDLLDSFLFQPFLQLNLKLLLNEKFKSLHLQNNPSVKLYSLLLPLDNPIHVNINQFVFVFYFLDNAII